MNGQRVWSAVSRILLALVFIGGSYAVEAGAAPVVTVIPPGSNASSGTYTSTAFPVDVTFTANGSATIYYTTNGADPTVGSPSSLAVTTAGSLTNTIPIYASTFPLKFNGD